MRMAANSSGDYIAKLRSCKALFARLPVAPFRFTDARVSGTVVSYWHLPAAHLPLEQTLPQAPQFLGSVCIVALRTHVPLHMV